MVYPRLLTNPTLNAGEEYYLVAWGINGNVSAIYISGQTGRGTIGSSTYSDTTPPSTMPLAVHNYQAFIYCTIYVS